MNAAETLRAALDAAPGLFVEPHGFTGEMTLWQGDREDDPFVEAVVSATPAGVQVEHMRLIGLLLAAAPHLADLLDALAPCIGAHDDKTRDAWMNLHAAITEAGESR